MEFLSHHAATDQQWQRYKQLELIPNFVPQPARATSCSGFGLGWIWRKLLALLIAELAAEQRLDEYFARCWSLNELGHRKGASSNSLRRFLILLD